MRFIKKRNTKKRWRFQAKMWFMNFIFYYFHFKNIVSIIVNLLVGIKKYIKIN
jgi:hypothetical protein